MTTFDGIVLDVDGTLVDSNDAHTQAWIDALSERGIQVPFRRIRPLIGLGGDKLLPAVTGILVQTAAGRAIINRRKAIFRQRYLYDLIATPGARALVSHLRACGFNIIVVSSAGRDELRLMLKLVGVSELMEQAISAEDLDRSKPNLDLITAALDRINLPAQHVVMLGDTPYDIRAAARADVKTIVFRAGGWPDHDLADALCIYDHPADLLSHFDQSPLSRARERGR